MVQKDLFGEDVKKDEDYTSLKMICANCMDFDPKNNTCDIV